MAARPDELIDSERIKHDIDRTREQMSGTIDEIQERLHPARLLHDATATVREASVDSMKRVFGRAGETAGRKAGEAKAASAAAADFARSHPLPAALLFAGLALVAAKVLGGSRRSMAESEDWDDASPQHRRVGHELDVQEFVARELDVQEFTGRGRGGCGSRHCGRNPVGKRGGSGA